MESAQDVAQPFTLAPPVKDAPLLPGSVMALVEIAAHHNSASFLSPPLQLPRQVVEEHGKGLLPSQGCLPRSHKGVNLCLLCLTCRARVTASGVHHDEYRTLPHSAHHAPFDQRARISPPLAPISDGIHRSIAQLGHDRYGTLAYLGAHSGPPAAAVDEPDVGAAIISLVRLLHPSSHVHPIGAVVPNALYHAAYLSRFSRNLLHGIRAKGQVVHVEE